MSVTPLTVVVTGVGAIIGQGVVRSLRRSSLPVRVVGMDRSDQSPGPLLCDAFYKKPTCAESEPQYLEFWAHVLAEERAALVLPALEVDVFFLDRHREFVERVGSRVALNRRELIDLASDKWALGLELARRGLPVIPSSRTDDWARATAELGPPPLLLKPRRGQGSRGIVRLHDETDFRFWRTKAGDNWLLQRIVGTEDDEYTVGHFGLGAGAALPPIVFRRRLSPAGNTQAAEVVDDPVIEAATRRLTDVFAPVGPTNYQFRKEGERAYLLEINPRFSSSASLRTAFGYNEAQMAVELYALGKTPEPPHVRRGKAWRYLEDHVVYDGAPV